MTPPRDHRTLTRRGVLGAGTAGATGLTGCVRDGGGESPDATATAQQQSAPVAQAATPNGSGRFGGAVYYDPTERGPYSDLEDAVSDVPTGGLLQLGPYDYDVAEEGRISLRRPIHVRGVGWTQVFPNPDNWESEISGTRLLNDGDDAVDEPVIEYDAGSKKEIKDVRLEHLYVKHTGEAPAVRFRDTSRTLMQRCNVNCGWEAPVGVKYEGAAYLAQQIQNTVRGFSDIGIHVQGTGYGHEFHQSVSVTGVENATALQTEVQRTIVVGGEYMAHNGSEGTAIKFFRRQGGLPAHGGLVLEPGIERTANPIVIDADSGPMTNVQMYHIYATVGERGVERVVRFGNARNCKLVNPVLPGNDSGELAHWSAESEDCTVVTDPNTLSRCSITNDGATRPHLTVHGSASDSQLQGFPDGVPISVDYAIDQGAPMYSDGSNWYRSAGERTSL